MHPRRLISLGILILTLLVSASSARAHVGSPDVYYEGAAGPYQLFVTIRPPAVIPGVADIQIHAAQSDISALRIVPLPLRGDGAKFAPTPDVATRLAADPQTFSGHLWMMTTGSWQVRILVDGKRGSGELEVPVPTLPQNMAGMQTTLGVVLAVLLFILVAGLISIVGASSGEAQLAPGKALSAEVVRRQRIAQGVAAVLLFAGLWAGARWWQSEAARFVRNLYRPLQMDAQVSGTTLKLKLQTSGWQEQRVNDLLPDHDHLMHLFVLHLPELDQVFHLHPSEAGEGLFTVELPATPAGRYQLYADIVHESGVPETLVAELAIPTAIAGKPLSGDDAAGAGPPLRAADPGRTVSPLADGSRMVWRREPGALTARQPSWFRFRIEDPSGQPATDMQLYMGMLGHAAFVKRDGSVFVHLHPSGSVPMAALSLTAQGAQGHAGHSGHSGHSGQHPATALPAEVSFPYGFPTAGDYRMFVQIKKGDRILTGVFDTHVNQAKPGQVD